MAVLGPPMCFIRKSRLDFDGIKLALPSVLCNKGETQDRIPRVPCGSLTFLAERRGCDWREKAERALERESMEMAEWGHKPVKEGEKIH